MTIRVRIYHDNIALPEGVHFPDGTMVEISVVTEDSANEAKPQLSFPTFRGDGLMPGVDLEDKEAIGVILDGDKYQQRP